MANCVCVSCDCSPCCCSSSCCTSCGCENCDGNCETPKYAPVKECIPEMTKPSFALGLDCDRRKRKILNKAKSILFSDGKNVKFRDGSEDDRIALELIKAAYSSSIVSLDGSGQLEKLVPNENDSDDYVLARIGNILGFHKFPTKDNEFSSSEIQNRNCGNLALIICKENGVAELAKWEACDVAAGTTRAITTSR